MREHLEHRPRLVQSKEHHLRLHGDHPVGRFNAWLALGITKQVGTMWAAYVFCLLAVGGAVAVLTNNALLTALSVLISQTFLQLVLLPIIMVGQNVQAAASDDRAEADHKTLTALHEINVQQMLLLKTQGEELALLRKVVSGNEGEKAHGRSRT